MQVAVVLFFAGLITLLWPINQTVAIVTSASVAIVVIAASLSFTLSLFADSCPYKTPLGWLILVNFRSIYDPCCRALVKLYYKLEEASKQWRPANYVFRPIRWIFHTFPDDFWNFQVHDAWAHRDLTSISIGQDPVRSAAWKCRSLLWVASHEEINAKTTMTCVSSLPGTPLPRSAGRRPFAALSSWTSSSWADESSQRLSSYWMAFSEYLDLHTHKSVPFLDMVQNDLIRIFDSHSDIREAVAQRISPMVSMKLISLNQTEFSLMFNLLASVIQRCDAAQFTLPTSRREGNGEGMNASKTGSDMQDRGPFSEDNLRLLHTTSLTMMNLLADGHKQLRAAYCGILIDILWRSTHSEDRRPAAISEGTELILALLHITIPPDFPNVGQ
jgi:hypothetical protein